MLLNGDSVLSEYRLSVDWVLTECWQCWLNIEWVLSAYQPSVDQVLTWPCGVSATLMVAANQVKVSAKAENIPVLRYSESLHSSSS